VSILLIRNYWLGSAPVLSSSVPAVQYPPPNQPQAQNQPQATRTGPIPGMKISHPDINWAKNGRTLLFVLSTQCGFCNASTNFYKQAVQEKQSIKDIQFVALFPQDIKQSEQYLKDNGIGIQDVKQTMPFSVGANGFPTLMLVDNTGTVKKTWVGKLSEEKEREVIEQMKVQ
jgi:Redoxin